jgi:hypothetical protein
MTWRSSLLSPDRLSAADYQLRRFPGHLQAGHGSCDGLPAHGRPHVPHRCRRPHLPRWLRRPRRHPRRHPDLLGQHVWPPSGGRVCHGVRSSRSAAPALPPPGLAKRHPVHPCTINYATDLHSPPPPPPPPPPARPAPPQVLLHDAPLTQAPVRLHGPALVHRVELRRHLSGRLRPHGRGASPTTNDNDKQGPCISSATRPSTCFTNVRGAFANREVIPVASGAFFSLLSYLILSLDKIRDKIRDKITILSYLLSLVFFVAPARRPPIARKGNPCHSGGSGCSLLRSLPSSLSPGV